MEIEIAPCHISGVNKICNSAEIQILLEKAIDDEGFDRVKSEKFYLFKKTQEAYEGIVNHEVMIEEIGNDYTEI